MDVYGLGTLAMDVLMKVDTLPREDGFCIIESSEKQPGGSGTNVIVQLARLDAQCGFMGAVGDDVLGTELVESLKQEKVHVSNMVVKPGEITLHTDIVIDKTGSKFIMLNMGGAFEKFVPEDVNAAAISKAKVFYTDLLPSEAAVYALRLAKKEGKKTVFNMQVGLKTMQELGLTKEEILAALSDVDVFAPCREGLYELTGTTDLDMCVKILRKYCGGILLFTLGDEGSVAYDENNEKYLAPICEVDVVDTTGAGDSYMGGFIYQFYLKNDGLGEAMKFASLCASYTCTGLGARYTPTLEQVENFKKKEKGCYERGKKED